MRKISSYISLFVLLLNLSLFAQDAKEVAFPVQDENKVNLNLQTVFPKYGENVLFNNGPLVTLPGGGCAGGDASILDQTLGLTVFGFSANKATFFYIADDFTSTANWRIDSIKFFSYQTGATTVSLTGVFVRIWNGAPNGGGTVVWGDTTTNRMSAARFTNIYRALNTTPTDCQRRIQEVIAPVNVTLPPGTYWVEWGFTGSLASGPWQPPITIAGQAVTGNALQRNGTTWQALVDGTNGQGAPFILYGGISDAGQLLPFNLTAPANNATITTLPGSTTPITITWDTSRANATYKWIFGAPVVPPRLLTIPTSTNSLTFTSGQLDSMLANFGINPGGSVSGQWDVWAFRNNPPQNDSLKSANGPRNITLTRGIPQLTPFNLATPPNNTTLVTSQFNTSPVVISWTRSGQGNRYRWRLWTTSPTSPLLNVQSGNNGFDSSITFINSQIDAILAGLGIAPGGQVNAQWAVWAYNGVDSLKSTQTFNITLRRQAQGDVLIAYDSTLASCRISRDSIIANLNLLGLTYDLFNRGTQTSTSVMSFRTYSRIIWLGEGTSVMSTVQKDSIKAFLNSGSPNNKKNLIIFAEDIGYQFGRTGSTYLDLDFMNNFLGANYVLDRPASGGAQGLVGVTINAGIPDSTIGSWPDVLSVFDTTTAKVLYRFRSDPTQFNAIGNKKANFEVATFGVDVESLRPASDSPAGSPVRRMLVGALNYLVIPVELKSFTASVNKNTVTLNWTTATETNNSGFYVQRKAGDSEFQNIGFVEGKGTTAEVQNYFFTDNRVTAGKYQYRLAQVDFDGTINYLDPIEVDVNPPLEFSLSQNYPNPFNPSTTIEFTLPVKSIVTLKVYDIIGQEVLKAIDTEMEAGYHKLDLNMSRFSSGVYMYRIDVKGVDGKNHTAVKKMILNK
ncbi:MAG: T9SS type A sorting domain-containing protein [Ignavibacterium sp.]|nr:T9SS type A sorting domain-containing protein [Ignavibacterium sp.]